MRHPGWTEILAVIAITIMLGLVAPSPRYRPPARPTTVPAPAAQTSVAAAVPQPVPNAVTSAR
jgi:hypothetical protein